jgi:hypothetical protein
MGIITYSAVKSISMNGLHGLKRLNLPAGVRMQLKLPFLLNKSRCKMNTGIECIQKTIRTSLADLHLMFTHDAVSIDIQYYNDVNLALLEAETAIY